MNTKNIEKEKVKESTLDWINRSFEAIPYQLFKKAYMDNVENQEVKILTSRMEDGSYEILDFTNFPTVIGSFFLVSERLDVDWILNNLDAVSECGFEVYESDDFIFIAIDGMGYDFLEAHWMPLYEARGIQWYTL